MTDLASSSGRAGKPPASTQLLKTSTSSSFFGIASTDSSKKKKGRIRERGEQGIEGRETYTKKKMGARTYCSSVRSKIRSCQHVIGKENLPELSSLNSSPWGSSSETTPSISDSLALLAAVSLVCRERSFSI